MSTISGLLLRQPEFTPFDLGRTLTQATNIQGGQLTNQTRLLELANLQQQQAAEQEYLRAIQTNPALAQQLFGGSVLGALGPPTGGPPGAITQAPLGGGPAQTVPAYPDASRYAGVSPQSGGPIPPDVAAQVMPTVTPPQSTLASLGPQPQGPPQALQNPLLEMARRDPRAALMLQKQLQTQQLNQLTMQEKHLDMGVKVSEGIARQLQGVTDQASLDEARERIRLIHPQAAAQIPQFYSKGAVEALQQRGIAMADQAKNRHYQAQSRKLDVESDMLPKMYDRILEEDAPGGQPPASGPGTTAVPAPAQSPVAPVEKARWDGLLTLLDQTADQEGVPRDLARAVVKQESNWDINAKGDGGHAKGWFQLHEGAAKDARIDPAQRHVPAQNILGGVRYLALKYKQAGGDWDKALALYNGGGDPNYVANVRQHLTSAQGTATTGGTGTTQAPATDPRIAQLEAKIAKRTRDAKLASLAGNESLSTRLNDDANRLTAEKKDLMDRLTEIPRAVEKETALQPLKVAQQRAGAEVQLETKMNEPIGIQAGDDLDLPASTKWKDVPKDRKPMPRPGEGERKALSDLRASVAGVDSLLTKLDDPTIAGMIGTIFTEPPAAVQRLLGPWLATMAPEQRAFAATIAGEIMEIRHRLIGAGQTGIEVAALEPMLPSPADTDPATVRAKLTALRDGMLRRHDAKRDDLEGLGFRVPAKLARPESPSGLTPAQQRLLDKHTR